MTIVICRVTGFKLDLSDSRSGGVISTFWMVDGYIDALIEPFSNAVLNTQKRSNTMKKGLILPAAVGLAAVWMITLAASVHAQTYFPSNWVIDPFVPNTNLNYTVSGANTASPAFSNTGAGLGSLFGNSPIGVTLNLINPGDSVTMSGQMSLAGNVNNSNVQFRWGLLYQGSASTDTNWLGYFVGLPNASGVAGLYMRNVNNTGAYTSGTGAATVQGTPQSFTGPLAAGTYDLSLSISLQGPGTDVVTWSVTGVSPNAYVYSGIYTNTVSTRGGNSFDQVGFLAGGSTFGSASVSDVITFNNIQVVFTAVPEPSTLCLAGMGLAGLLFYRRCRR